MQIGIYHELKILKNSSFGLFLGNDAGEEVLLPNKYCPKEFEIGELINVFIYRDAENRIIATTLKPRAALGEFGFFEVKTVAHSGAFLDWGLAKDIMVPFKEQKSKMEEGRWYVARVDLDKETDRLFASSRIEKYVQNVNLSVEEGEQVELMVYQKTDLGYSAIINDLHKGLIYGNEVFDNLHVGDRRTGFVKTIREDHKIDLSLQPIGYRQFNDINADKILEILRENDGVMRVTDNSSPEEIYELLGMSKKAFKKAIGGLYKARRITMEKNGIWLR